MNFLYLDDAVSHIQLSVFNQTYKLYGNGIVIPFSEIKEQILKKIMYSRRYQTNYLITIDETINDIISWIKTWNYGKAGGMHSNITYQSHDPMDLFHFHRCTGIKAYPKIKRKRRPLNPHFVMSSIQI